MRRAFLLGVVLLAMAGGLAAAQCKATPGAQLDPGYAPSAPKRASVGSGMVVTGTIRASSDCLPIAGATVEYWMAGPPPHIHMNVAEDAFLPIQTEFFPGAGTASGVFDIVLDPAD